jgi:hypothetical protein
MNTYLQLLMKTTNTIKTKQILVTSLSVMINSCILSKIEEIEWKFSENFYHSNKC